MHRPVLYRLTRQVTVICGFVFTATIASTVAARPDSPAADSSNTVSQRREVNWRLPGGQRIRAIHDSPGKPVPTRDKAHTGRLVKKHKQLTSAERTELSRLRQKRSARTTPTVSGSVTALTINSPPIDGFIPYIAVQATNKRKTSDEWNASPSSTVLGSYTAPNPTTNYGIGLFDTGAGITVLSHANSSRFGLLNTLTYNTQKTVTIQGVTGSVDAWVSQPIGVWMDGLHAIDPVTNILNTSNMVGQWNVSVAMGPEPMYEDAPDLATAIGSPMAVYYTTAIDNNQMTSITREGHNYDAPKINFYDHFDPAIPEYPNSLSLELRPLGAADVMYWPCFSALEFCPGGDGSPSIPSFIMGISSQSLLFVSSVTLGHKGHLASDRQRFIIDTGAQITVIGSRTASLLALNPSYPDFTVEVEGVDGQIVDMPGFYIDSLEMPAIGEWLSYARIPVVMLDVTSPEGGTLDGIIGMNLFNRYNLVLRGGGMPGMGEPWLDFEPLPSVYADFDGDNDVDADDFGLLQACFSGLGVPADGYCVGADLNGDTAVDRFDLQVFIQCASGPEITAAPECLGQ